MKVSFVRDMKHFMENFFPVRVAKPWNRLPGGVVDAPCLPVFEGHLDSAPSNVP